MVATERAIAAVLAEYAYSNFTVVSASQKRLAIGDLPDNKYFFQPSLSTEDIYVFATDSVVPQKRKVIFAFRGTSTMEHIVHTWPVIAVNREDSSYGLWTQFFIDQQKHVKTVLDKLGKFNAFDNVIFTGHSMGGSAARISQRNYEGSKAYVFNPGEGLFRNNYVSKIARSFLSGHVGQAVRAVGVPGTVVKFTQDNAKEAMKQWIAHVQQPDENLEVHRVEADVVSLLGAFSGKNQFWYENQGSFIQILKNHEMDSITRDLQKQAGEELEVSEEEREEGEEGEEGEGKEETSERPPERRRRGFQVNFGQPTLDMLGGNDIQNFNDLIRTSRLAFYNDINSLNTIHSL